MGFSGCEECHDAGGSRETVADGRVRRVPGGHECVWRIRGEVEGHRAGGGRADNLYFCEHHESHAASAFFPSPFECAAVLTMDGVGEWATTSMGHGTGNRVDILE